MKFTALALSLIASTAYASFEKIGPLVYEPRSLVTDHNAIDLDQQAIQIELAKLTGDGFQNAKEIYQEGGYSKSYAVIKLNSSLTSQVTKGTVITGRDTTNEMVNGKAYSTYEAGVSEIIVQYSTLATQGSYVNCQVGKLTEPNTDGCFESSGDLSIGGVNYGYTYDVSTDNDNGRTIQGFSESAEAKMHTCTNCPYAEYNKYYKYYGEFDYANQWVLAALDGTSTYFKNGNADFSKYDFEGREQAVKKGTAYMAVYMYVIRELEDAVDDCNNGCIDCNDDPVHAWDEAVAFYTGSTSDQLLYALADKRCINFKTCGTEGSESSIMTSKVNYDIFGQFALGQQSLLEGDCPAVKVAAKRITDLMAVPLIQGTIRYAYKVDVKMGEEVEKAEGATFAAAVLPRVHDCSAVDAKTIYDNMRVNAPDTNFAAVKTAFENNYECMNIKCNDVGGLYSVAAYSEGAEPCSDVGAMGSPNDGSSGANSMSLSLGLGLATLFATVISLM
mmetsp:Transcript_19089/g.37919  ORF Transcript_19089/g.37919 Transcript_19089/m.37919 type:complete len:502 (+) Transcript_19089:223-1728(+)